jgi:alkylation response protein AidB-like acyl-CoA dehydrogenase
MDQRTPPDLAYDVIAAARQVAAAAAARAGEQDRDDGFPAQDVADLAHVGLLAAPIPSDEGGVGLGEEPDARDLARVLRLVGYGSLALGRIYEGHVNALQLVARYGTFAQQARLFADARAMHLFGVWNTDAPGDSLRLGDDRRHRGVKTFASGAGYVTRALVTVKREPGAPPLMLVVPLEPGSRADLTGW